jgi:hypothetical protein
MEKQRITVYTRAAAKVKTTTTNQVKTERVEGRLNRSEATNKFKWS